MTRDPSLVWFTHTQEILPQHVIVELKDMSKIRRVGIFLHGENNQNPKRMLYIS